jgi:hypothetical protein
VLQVQPQQKAVVPCHPAMQGFLEPLRRRGEPRMGERGELGGIALAGHQRRQHRPPAPPEQVGDHRVELDVGVLKGLLQPLRVAGLLADQLLAGA